MTAFDYFIKEQKQYANFYNKCYITLKKLRVHHAILSERIMYNYSENKLNRIYQILDTERSILQKIENIDNHYLEWCKNHNFISI